MKNKAIVGEGRAVSHEAYLEEARKFVEGEEAAGRTFANSDERNNRIAAVLEARNPWSRLDLDHKVDVKFEGQVKADQILEERTEEVRMMFEASRAAKTAALDVTFQNRDTKFIENLLTTLRNHPRTASALGFMMPFIRTPWNVMRFSVHRSPLGLAMSDLPQLTKVTKDFEGQYKNILKQLQSDDPKAVNAAIEKVGRIGSSVMISASAIGLAQVGMITGSGPRDINQRNQLVAAGWQPYSIRIPGRDGAPDRYFSYSRVEPFATTLAIYANLTEALSDTKRPDTTVAESAMGVVTQTMTQILDKTFLSGFSGLIDAMESEDPNKVTRWLQRIPQTMLAPPGAANVTRTFFDDGTMRELDTFVKGVLGRTPGMQGVADPRRNIFGEALKYDNHWSNIVNPIYHSAHKQDPILDEVTTFEQGLSLPKHTIGDEIDLKEWRTEDGKRTLMDVYEERVGTIKVGNKTLRQSLRDLMATARYQKLPALGAMGDFNDPRAAEFNKIIGRYRRAARRELLRNNPKLREAYNASKASKRMIQRGNLTPTQAYQYLNPET
jgi:hypothetical protein